jgi:hypothetical protein
VLYIKKNSPLFCRLWLQYLYDLKYNYDNLGLTLKQRRKTKPGRIKMRILRNLEEKVHDDEDAYFEARRMYEI